MEEHDHKLHNLKNQYKDIVDRLDFIDGKIQSIKQTGAVAQQEPLVFLTPLKDAQVPESLFQCAIQGLKFIFKNFFCGYSYSETRIPRQILKQYFAQNYLQSLILRAYGQLNLKRKNICID